MSMLRLHLEGGGSPQSSALEEEVRWWFRGGGGGQVWGLGEILVLARLGPLTDGPDVAFKKWQCRISLSS